MRSPEQKQVSPCEGSMDNIPVNDHVLDKGIPGYVYTSIAVKLQGIEIAGFWSRTGGLCCWNRWRIDRVNRRVLRMASEENQGKNRDLNNPCLFCTDPQGVSLVNDLAYSARDTCPASPGHSVVIPKRHVASYFNLTPREVYACMELICEERKLLDQAFSTDV